MPELVFGQTVAVYRGLTTLEWMLTGDVADLIRQGNEWWAEHGDGSVTQMFRQGELDALQTLIDRAQALIAGLEARHLEPPA